VLDTREQAIHDRQSANGLMQLTDRRVPYLSIRYSEWLVEIGIKQSVGLVASPYDDALAETVIGLFKAKVIRSRGSWRHLEAVECATLDWVYSFNHKHMLGPMGISRRSRREHTFTSHSPSLPRRHVPQTQKPEELGGPLVVSPIKESVRSMSLSPWR